MPSKLTSNLLRLRKRFVDVNPLTSPNQDKSIKWGIVSVYGGAYGNFMSNVDDLLKYGGFFF